MPPSSMHQAEGAGILGPSPPPTKLTAEQSPGASRRHGDAEPADAALHAELISSNGGRCSHRTRSVWLLVGDRSGGDFGRIG